MDTATPHDDRMHRSPPRPLLLCILDGWGCLPDGPSNSIEQADTPYWDCLLRESAVSTLEASALDVGLPGGQMGNSEVGHMNLGAGRIVMQDLVRVDNAVDDGSLATHKTLLHFAGKLKGRRTVHLIGLLSPGGVHSHQHHMAELARALDKTGVTVCVHAFLDGRDTPPKSALEFVAQFQKEIHGCSNVRIATVSGRFYAMDRDNRWDRIEAAYYAITGAKGKTAPDAASAIEAAYAADETDEFVTPTIIGSYSGAIDGDGLLMANFRADRAREILTALLDPKFDKFERKPAPSFTSALGLVEYSTELNELMGAIFEPEDLRDTLGEVVAKAGLRQLRIAETEKYAHVTFFFNGGREEPFAGEERILVPSPKVKTYDLKPEMSAFEVTDKLVAAIQSKRFDVIIANYANPDMVGHTGIIPAAIKAVEAIDTCLGRLADAIDEAGGTMLITADHGNVEQMTDPMTQEPHTAHTTNPVPIVLVNAPSWIKGLHHGRLADISPTLLQIMGLPQPAVMSGHSLLEIESNQNQSDRPFLRASA